MTKVAPSSLANRTLSVRDPALEAVADKVLNAQRLSFAEGMTLFNTPDFPTVETSIAVLERAG